MLDVDICRRNFKQEPSRYLNARRFFTYPLPPSRNWFHLPYEERGGEGGRRRLCLSNIKGLRVLGSWFCVQSVHVEDVYTVGSNYTSLPAVFNSSLWQQHLLYSLGEYLFSWLKAVKHPSFWPKRLQSILLSKNRLLYWLLLFSGISVLVSICLHYRLLATFPPILLMS